MIFAFAYMSDSKKTLNVRKKEKTFGSFEENS